MTARPPRDWLRIRDRYFGILYNFIITKSGVVCLMGLAGLSSYLLSGNVESGIVGGIVVFTIIVFIKVLYFHDVPKGWTYYQWRHWLQFSNRDFISRNRRWIMIGIGVLVIVGLIRIIAFPDSFGVIGLLGMIGVVAMMLDGYRKFRVSRNHSRTNY